MLLFWFKFSVIPVFLRSLPIERAKYIKNQSFCVFLPSKTQNTKTKSFWEVCQDSQDISQTLTTSDIFSKDILTPLIANIPIIFSRPWKLLVCVTEQHYVLIFFTRLWSLCNPLLFDTKNPGISGFSTAHAYKHKTKRQAKIKRRQRKITFFSHKPTQAEVCVQTINGRRISKRSIVLLRRQKKTSWKEIQKTIFKWK